MITGGGGGRCQKGGWVRGGAGVRWGVSGVVPT